MALVDVEPGPLQQRAAARARPATGRPEYHLYFADFRQQYVSPRGGRLRAGACSTPRPRPRPQSLGRSAAGAATPGVPELIAFGAIDASAWSQMCQARYWPCPAAWTTRRPPRDLKWFGNHARTELEKLLVLANCVYRAAAAIGQGKVDKITSEGEPADHAPM